MSDSIYEKNLQVVAARYPKIAECLDNPRVIAGNEVEESLIDVGVTTVANKKILYATKGDKTYRLDSLYDSGEMLDLWFRGLGDDWDLNSKLFMYGLGNGLYARKFLNSARPDCKMFIHEPSCRVFRTVMENFDMSDILSDTRIRIVLGPLFSHDALMEYYQDIMEYTDVYSLKTSVFLNYPELFTEDVAEYAQILTRARDFAGANQKVTDRFGGLYTKNTFGNLEYLRESKDIVRFAGQIPGGIPAIVVAAGPSLDKNISELKKAKGKCIIISTDTALKPLSLAGIVPDIAVIIDGKKDERYLSEEDSRRVPLVCTPRSGTEFLHLHTGIKFFTDDFCDHIKGFMSSVGLELYKLENGGSVANACFSLAELFGCKTIILMGQDLAYTGDKTHSKVTVRGSVKTEIENLEHVVMDTDIDGNPIRSSQEFRYYREWFEKKIAENHDLTVIDATEGGVRIAGSLLMTARDAIEKYCVNEYDFTEEISKSSPLFDDETKKKYDEFVRRVPHQLDELRRIIKQTLADYTSMRMLVVRNNYHSTQMKKLYENCQKQTERIESSPVIEYVHNQLQDKSSELLENVNKLEKDEKQELLAVCDIGEKYLRDMELAVSELEPYMDIIKRDMGSRS